MNDVWSGRHPAEGIVTALPGFQFDVATHAPFLAAGAVVGVLAFAELLLVLVPVLLRKRRASLAKGFLGIALSFATLLAGVVAVHLLAVEALLAFLIGELAGLFVCWTILACIVVMRR